MTEKTQENAGLFVFAIISIIAICGMTKFSMQQDCRLKGMQEGKTAEDIVKICKL